MPLIPKAMANDVVELLASHQITQKLLKPKNVQLIENSNG